MKHLAAAALTLLTLSLAACGSGPAGTPGVPHNGSPTTPQEGPPATPNDGLVMSVRTVAVQADGYTVRSALQPDGKIVTVSKALRDGAVRLVVSRLLPGGEPDPTFGTSGSVVLPEGAAYALSVSLALQPDGKIVLGAHRVSKVGYTELVAVRLTAGGALDADFGENGRAAVPTPNAKTSVAATAIAVSPEGLILVGGEAQRDASGTATDFVIVRVLPNGDPDASFGEGGAAVLPLSADDDNLVGLLSLPGGRVAAVGYRAVTGTSAVAVLAGLTARGKLDPDFAVGGVASWAEPGASVWNAATLDGQGRLVLAGWTEDPVTKMDRALVARFAPNGTLDPAFGQNGSTTLPVLAGSQATALGALPDGRVLLVGEGYTDPSAPDTDLLVARLTANGAVDPTFGSGGTTIVDFGGDGAEGADVFTTPQGVLVTGFVRRPSRTGDLVLVRLKP